MSALNELPLVIYHGNCADGFTAAWAVHKAMPAEFVAASYQAPPPEVSGRDVIMVDFCYRPDVMLQLQLKAKSILVLDHHKSASEDLPENPLTDPDQLTVFRSTSRATQTWAHFRSCVRMDAWEGITKAVIYAVFDQERSGAGIAWDFFHPGIDRPPLVDHVEDRDLWRFALTGTREIQAAIFSRPYTFDAWDKLSMMHPDTLRQEGVAIERKHHKDVAELVKLCKRRMHIAGRDVPVACIPITMTSDAGALMSDGEPFAACYWDTENVREFSLRSGPGGIDVSAIARHYGGGGHARAAGFRVPRDHELARA